MNKRQECRNAEYEADDWRWRECEVIERNGSLIYVEDSKTGERDWVDYRMVRR